MSRADDLLARVLAEPGDDELRKVLADALVEEGHPRGELIHLQYARLEGRGTPELAEREQLLLERHGADLLGPLIGVVESYRVERGFLASCRVPWHRPRYNLERVRGHPLWATVEELDAPASVYLDPALRSLRALRTSHEPRVSSLDELCGGTTIRRLQRLELTDQIQTYLPEVLFDAPALPDLRELEVRWLTEPDDLSRFAGTPITRRLERLVTHHARWLEGWHAAIERVRPARSMVFENILVPGNSIHTTIELHTGEGRYDHARVTFAYARYAAVIPSLALLRPGVRRLDVVLVTGGTAIPSALPARIEAELAAFPESSCVVRES